MQSTTAPEVILASGSAARRQLLEAAGVPFRVVPSAVDEDLVRADLARTHPDAHGTQIARLLARAKAEDVSWRHPAALVIGADQVLEAGHEIFNKPKDLAAARRHLLALAGRAHRLVSAVSLAEGGTEIWQDLDVATLTMRDLGETSVDAYLAAVGERVCACVGAYELEGRGVQLFDDIDGDYFTILGLPLLPLLAELRRRSIMAS
jgi:septum formation protein